MIEIQGFAGKKVRLMHGDVMECMRTLPDASVDLVLTDPPYNIKKAKWDNIDHYTDWCAEWMRECKRVLKPNGVFYFWHNNIPAIMRLMHMIEEEHLFVFNSFCIWDKSQNYRRQSWANRKQGGATALRSWFNACEYLVHFFCTPGTATAWNKTGFDMINSNAECYKPLKEWYVAEKARLGLTDKDIGEAYTKATGRRPYMLRHYFQNNQFEIPTQAVWDAVYMPLGFSRSYEALRQEYEALRQEYEALRQEYEALRNYHMVDEEHCNVFRRGQMQSSEKMSRHPCEKPLEILERVVNVSCPPGGVVLDCFMGGGSTGAACMRTGRNFIGIEKDDKYFDTAARWIAQEADSFAY